MTSPIATFERRPLRQRFLVLGVLAGLIGGAVFSSLLASLAFLVVCVMAGLLWRRDEPPVLAFALACQWIYVVAGYLFSRIKGYVPGDKMLGDVEGAILLALLGFLALAAGIVMTLRLLRLRLDAHLRRLRSDVAAYSVDRLFWYTMGLYSVSWVVEIVPMDIFFNGAQVIYAVLSIREVLLALLWLVILRQREGYRYGVIATVWALIPLFISPQSKFKELLYLVMVVLLAEWRPWSRSLLDRRRSGSVLCAVVLLSAGLVFAGVLWEGAVKPYWRTAEVTGTPVNRLQAFGRIAADPIRQLDLKEGFEALVSRVDSIWPFSLVLERVPKLVPHENGSLLRRSVAHVLMPRILFPNKPNLGVDSWLATNYGGIVVAEGTSVGIGYMAEFYVDFGVPWMFLPLLGYGMLLGATYCLLMLKARSYHLSHAVIIIPFLNHFLTFEGNFTKLLGGLLMNLLVLVFFLHFVAPWLHRTLQRSPAQPGLRASALAHRDIDQKRWAGMRRRGNEIAHRRARRSRSLAPARQADVAEPK